jgi:hypothetical protein
LGLSEENTARDLQLRLRATFRDLLKPVRVKSVVITKAERNAVRGILMTACPIEKGESGKDFEVGLEGNKGGSITYVSVDGRRLIPRRQRAKASRRRGGRN